MESRDIIASQAFWAFLCRVPENLATLLGDVIPYSSHTVIPYSPKSFSASRQAARSAGSGSVRAMGETVGDGRVRNYVKGLGGKRGKTDQRRYFSTLPRILPGVNLQTGLRRGLPLLGGDPRKQTLYLQSARPEHHSMFRCSV